MKNNFQVSFLKNFKKFFLGFGFCLSMLSLSSCSEYDDTWIKDAIEDLSGRVAALEDWCKTANSNISSLQALVSVLEQNDYITGVTPVTENGKEIGYTITFKNSPAIIVYHGKDGENGDTPVIGVGKDDDGLYYWTQTIGDGESEFIIDEQGNKIAATCTAPRLSVDSEGYWLIDTDGNGFVRMKDENGNDVKAVGEKGDTGDTGATGPAGPAGDSIFKTIDYSNSDYVLITLIDGTIIKIARQPIADVTQAGSLEEALRQAGMDPSTLTEIPIVGTLDAEDFKYIREELTALKSLDMGNADVTVLPERALQKTDIEAIVLPKGLKEIGNSTFYNCNSLKSLDIPASVTTLGRWIVEGCSSLESITLHEGLTTLSASTFYGVNVKGIVIPSTVSIIPEWCFESAKLTSINIPSTVQSVGIGAFYGCEQLETAIIEADLTEIPELMFYLSKSLKTVNLPESIVSIGADAFNGCPLQMDNGILVIPSNVKTIGERAFSTSTSNITSIQFPEGLEEIGESAFYNIKKIREVVLPSSLKKMNDSPFYWYKSQSGSANSDNDDYVRKITFKGSIPPEIIYTHDAGGNLMKPNVRYMAECEVYVPVDAIDAYKASVWFTGTDAYDKPNVFPIGCEYFKVDNLKALGSN